MTSMMLDEVIEHLKYLQAQVQIKTKMSSLSHMMMPMSMQQMQMAMMGHMGMGMGMGVMAINAMIRSPQVSGMASMLHPAAFAFLTMLTPWDGSAERLTSSAPAVVPDPFAAFLACQTQAQPMTMDAYNRMAALCQQIQHGADVSVLSKTKQ